MAVLLPSSITGVEAVDANCPIAYVVFSAYSVHAVIQLQRTVIQVFRKGRRSAFDLYTIALQPSRLYSIQLRYFR